MIGNEGKKLVDWAQKKGWYILNGSTERKLGQGIYVGYRSNTVIDCVIE